MTELLSSAEPPAPTRVSEAGSPEVTLLYLIKQVELAVRSHLDDAVHSAGLTALQYTALTVLERHPELTSAELARNSFVRAQTMAQMITVLDDGGLITRKRDPDSHRQYLLSLSEKGQDVLDSLRDAVAAIESKMVADMTAAQSRQLSESLHSCRVALGGARAH